MYWFLFFIHMEIPINVTLADTKCAKAEKEIKTIQIIPDGSAIVPGSAVLFPPRKSAFCGNITGTVLN